MRIGRPKPSPGMLFYNLSGSGTTWKSIAHFAPNVLPIAATESFNEIKQPPHHISVGSYNPVYYFRLFYPANCIFFKYTYDNPYTYYGKRCFTELDLVWIHLQSSALLTHIFYIHHIITSYPVYYQTNSNSDFYQCSQTISQLRENAASSMRV